MLNAMTFEGARSFTGPIYLVEVCPVRGGTLDHPSNDEWDTRRRFWNDSHGPRGRKRYRLKGAPTIRHP